MTRLFKLISKRFASPMVLSTKLNNYDPLNRLCSTAQRQVEISSSLQSSNKINHRRSAFYGTIYYHKNESAMPIIYLVLDINDNRRHQH